MRVCHQYHRIAKHDGDYSDDTHRFSVTSKVLVADASRQKRLALFALCVFNAEYTNRQAGGEVVRF